MKHKGISARSPPLEATAVEKQLLDREYFRALNFMKNGGNDEDFVD